MSPAVLPETKPQPSAAPPVPRIAPHPPRYVRPQPVGRRGTLGSRFEDGCSRIQYAWDLGRYWAFNRIPPRPRMFGIEITNHCNLKCAICDRSAMSREKKLMEWSLFERICTDAIEFGVPQIGLGWFGESMLHPQLPEMIAFAKRNGAKSVAFTTNGTLLTEENTRNCLEAGLDRIEVSIDGATRSTFESVRVGASYDEVVANVHTLLRIRDELKAPTKVQLNFVCTTQTINELRPFYRKWRNLVDGFFFIPFMGYAGVQNMSPMPPPSHRTKCYMLWYMLISSVDGRAGVCCQGDPDINLEVGDLRTQTLKEVWNGPGIHRVRRTHFRRAWNELPVCGRCDVTYPYMRWMRHFISTYRRIHLGL